MNTSIIPVTKIALAIIPVWQLWYLKMFAGIETFDHIDLFNVILLSPLFIPPVVLLAWYICKRLYLLQLIFVYLMSLCYIALHLGSTIGTGNPDMISSFLGAAMWILIPILVTGTYSIERDKAKYMAAKKIQ